jgi:hypothetical protein
MKHLKTYLLLVLITSSFVTFSQHKPFQFGFKGGINAGWFAVDADGYSNNGAKFGGSWGFVADFFLMEGYSFTTGFDVLYLNGSVTSPSMVDSLPGNLERDIKTKYVELPLIFTMKTKKIKEKVRIYGQVGLGISFLLSAKSNDTYYPDDEGSPVKSEENVYDEVRFTRESLILGVGVEIPIQRSTYVRTGFKFDNAFIDVLKDNDAKARNNFLELSAAVIF